MWKLAPQEGAPAYVRVPALNPRGGAQLSRQDSSQGAHRVWDPGFGVSFRFFS